MIVIALVTLFLATALFIVDIWIVVTHFGTSVTPIKSETGVSWRQGINGMGWVHVSLSHGTILTPKTKFNVSISASLWDPYEGSATYEFYFKIYERTLSGQYSTPTLEKNVTLQKDKNEMWVELDSGNLTLTGPATSGIYIYKLCLGTLDLKTQFPTSWNYTLEVPILIYPPYYPTG